MSLTPEIRRQLGTRRGEVAHSIYNELGKRNLTATKLAKQLGCSVNNVSRVIRGDGHSQAVLNALRAAGVPERYLYDPERYCASEGKKQEVA